MNSWLIDTNVLIYSYDIKQQHHSFSYTFVEKCISGEITGIIAHQNILEFLAVVTDPRRVENPLTFDQALQKIAVYVSTLPCISPLKITLFSFAGLLSKYGTTRKRIFDLYLVATALDNNVSSICTWNTKDFQGIEEIEVKSPVEILETLK